MSDEMKVTPRGPLTGQEPPAPAVTFRQWHPAPQRARATDQRLSRAAGRLSTALARLRLAAGPELEPEVDEVTVRLFEYAWVKSEAYAERATRAVTRAV